MKGRDLRLLVGAIGVSALGDFLALIPLALYLQETTGSGILVAALFVFGPLAGGVLAAAGGMRLAMLVNAASFVVVALAVAALHARRAPVVPSADGAVEPARDGIVFLFRDAMLAVVMAVAFVSLLFMTASAAAEVFFAKDVLEVGDVGYGVLLASWTLGMALGATFVAPRVAVPMLAVGALVAIVVQGAGLALPALWLVFAFAALAYFVGGLAHGTKNVLVWTLMHRRVPERLHGRAFAAYAALRNGAELVALLGGGLLIVALGARWTLFVAGAVPVLTGLVAIAVAWRRLEAPVVSEAQAA